MNGLRRVDLEALLDFVVDAGEFEFDRPYPPGIVARLGELVPNDCLAYQELDLQARRTQVLMGVDGAMEDDEDETLYWSLGPCPISVYRTATGDLAAVRMSDVTDRRRYIETPFYKDYFEPFGLEHMIDLGLPAAPAWHRSFILFRTKGDRDFSERDRVVLNALRPHLARLEAEASLRRRLADALRSHDRDAEPGPYSQLTTREREIVELVAEGKTNAQIAAQLWVAPSTVKKHLEHVYEKLGVGRRTAAVTAVPRFR
jgi:DNA-binding CsgD family transcriptional regulator